MKKVLIVTYYWPPSGGGGVQRWLKFAKYLPQHGYTPIILTPENPDFQHQDKSLIDEIPQEAIVIREKIWEPYSLFRLFAGRNTSVKYQQGIVPEREKTSLAGKLFTWIRGNLFIPDPRKYWVTPAVRRINRMLRREEIDVMVTTGPPHSMHLIGLKLKAQHGLKWIADFRDPWSDWDMLDKLRVSGKTLRRHRQLEKRVLTQADATLAVSQHWAEALKKRGAKRVEVITNGYDPDNFVSGATRQPEKFRICHVGLLNEFRAVPVFWDTLAALCEENDELNRSLEVLLAGMVSKKLLVALQEHPRLGAKIRYRNYIPHADLHQTYQVSAALLLVLNESKNATGHIPGKLFEYLAARRPIIALGPSEGDAAGIISSHNPFPMQSPRDPVGIRSSILQSFEIYRNNAYALATDPEKYSRARLTSKLADLLDSLTSS